MNVEINNAYCSHTKSDVPNLKNASIKVVHLKKNPE